MMEKKIVFSANGVGTIGHLPGKKKRIQTQNLHLSQKLTEYKSEYERKNVKF